LKPVLFRTRDDRNPAQVHSPGASLQCAGPPLRLLLLPQHLQLLQVPALLLGGAGVAGADQGLWRLEEEEYGEKVRGAGGGGGGSGQDSVETRGCLSSS